MQFKWIDYNSAYKDDIETWNSDEQTKKYAIDDGINAEHLYYLDDDDYIHNESYFCKLVLEEDNIIAVIFLFDGEKHPLGINPIIVNPDLRNQGYCKRVIKELMEHTVKIIGKEKYVFYAGIDLDNTASIRAFENVGFTLTDMHPGGDFGYYHYKKEAPHEMEAQVKEIWAVHAQEMAKIVQEYERGDNDD
jgi:RimJ/RimL family protein N-acetyltransferase